MQVLPNFSGKHLILEMILKETSHGGSIPPFNSSTRNFLAGMRPAIILGRYLGCFPSVRIAKNHVTVSHRKLQTAFVGSLLLSIVLLLNAVLLLRLNVSKFQKDKTVLVRLEGFCHVGYASSMLLVYVYQLLAANKLRTILDSFITSNEASVLTSFVHHRNVWRYPVFSKLVLVFCLAFGIVENALFDYQSLHRGTVSGQMKRSTLELYYFRNFHHWHCIFPKYNPYITFILTGLLKVTTWGWTYIDIVCILLCRALWEKMWIIWDNLQWQTSIFSKHPFEMRTNTDEGNHRVLISAKTYQDEYIAVVRLVEKVQRYISPLIVICHLGNMYVIVVMLFNWIGPFSWEEASTEKSVHVFFTFVQFSFRVCITTYFAAEVYQMSIKFRTELQKSPNGLYTHPIERLDWALMANPTAISLFGAFMITRKYFVSIIKFIFTTEIVLLQSFSGQHNQTAPT